MEWKPAPANATPFFGLRRSGNHAVLDWIFGHCNSWIHANDCRIEDGQIRGTHVECVSAESPFTLMSFEDYDLGFLREHLTDCPEPILLLRDPFNMFASRLKMVRNFNDNKSSGFTCLDMISSRGFEMWKRYARAFLSDQYLNINFNWWFSNIQYREDTSRRLGFAFTDKKFGSKDGWKHSGGSSFVKMNPLNSYVHMANDPEFLTFFDEETIELSHQIFNWVPDLAFQYQNLTEIEDLVNSAKSMHDVGQTELGLLCLEQSDATLAKQMKELLLRKIV